MPSKPNQTKPLTPPSDGASTSLLPLTADAPANLTIALRLSVNAGIELPSSPLLEAKAVAGAFINIPEVILGEQFTTAPKEDNCILPATAEININAGVFVDVGADIGDVTLIDFNPTLSTTLFSAATSTCFVTAGQETGTALPPLATGTAGASGTGAAGAITTACPVALVTETATAASTFSITSCAAQVANCPSSLAQVIVVTEAAGAVTSRCPVTAPFANSTLPTAGSGGATISLSSLTDPVTNTLSVDPAVQTPDVPRITGSPRSPPADAPAEVTAAPVMEKPQGENMMPVKVVTATFYKTVAPPCAPENSAAHSAYMM